MQHERYLEELVFHYPDWYELRFFQTMDFMPPTIQDVYDNNRYCMSWFYNGIFSSDDWEEEYDNWLCHEVFTVVDSTNY